MAEYLRLRQICVAARSLEPLVSDLAAMLEIEVCHRDPALAVYGLENAVLPIGASFLEVVAPVREGTAVGRFLDKFAGAAGYMVIFDCNDPDRRRRSLEATGIRIANVISHDDYIGVQLHPRDCRAAMIEFNHTRNGEDLHGHYHPAGANWTRAVSTRQAKQLLAVEAESPDPNGLAAHWSRLMELPVSSRSGAPSIVTGHGVVRFLPLPSSSPERLGAVRILTADIPAACSVAADRGYMVEENEVSLGSVRLRFDRQPAA